MEGALPSTADGDSMESPERTNFHAGALLQMVEDLQVPFTLERSIRLCPGALLAKRFLLTLTKSNMVGDPDETVLALCRRLSMPEPLLGTTRRDLPAAQFIHFGFEENEKCSLYKVYLEFGSEGTTPGETILLHRAFKWDIADNSRHVETQYILHRSLTVSQMLARLDGIYQGSNTESCDLAKTIVGMAANQPGHEISYLEVNEDANGRRSFDVNVYDAGLHVEALQPVLQQMCRRYAISAEQFQTLYDQIKDHRFGHLAGGVHRNGQDFFNLYYGAQRRPGRTRSPRTGWTMGNVQRLQHTTEQDQYYNYCWWPYVPVAPVDNKFRPVNLLHHTFEVAGMDERATQLVERIQAEIGLFRTVWGAKWLPAAPYASEGSETVDGRLAWEFYFYDYQRRQREVSITRLIQAIKPLMRCDVPVNEGLAYFMFSLDVNAALLSGQQELDVVHMYIGNPGSRVSSGIAYGVTAAGTTLENFYFFFDAQRDLRAAAEKIYCSAHVDSALIDIDRLLWPELRDCHTICVANKQRNDTVYFSGIHVEQLLFFLKRLRYPGEIIGYIESNRGKLDHLLYDVGYDYVAKGRELEFVKSGYYGVF